jgi:hypothetical protein
VYIYILKRGAMEVKDEGGGVVAELEFMVEGRNAFIPLVQCDFSSWEIISWRVQRSWGKECW